ncbi:hypothetical protein XPA_007950 [Xanthoria parietina]
MAVYNQTELRPRIHLLQRRRGLKEETSQSNGRSRPRSKMVLLYLHLVSCRHFRRDSEPLSGRSWSSSGPTERGMSRETTDFFNSMPRTRHARERFFERDKRRKGGINVDELVLCSVFIVMIGFGQEEGRRILDDYFEEASAANRKRYIKGT